MAGKKYAEGVEGLFSTTPQEPVAGLGSGVKKFKNSWNQDWNNGDKQEAQQKPRPLECTAEVSISFFAQILELLSYEQKVMLL